MISKARAAFNRRWGALLDVLNDKPGPFEKEFIAHNKRVWRGYRPELFEGGEILIEANRIPGCNVALSYVGQYLGRSQHAKLVVYGKGISRLQTSVYSSFADEFLHYRVPPQDEIDTLFAAIFPTIATKRDLENLCVDGLWIGDLIYDTYIRRWDCVTVDLASEKFAELLHKSLGYLIWWRKYFAEHSVRAVLVSHSIFSWAGIITRVAVSRSVPVYLCQMNRLYYITQSHNMRAYNEYVDHHDFFVSLPPAEQVRGLREAERRIAKRFRGERDVGGHHLLKPTYLAKTGTRVLDESPRPKILVAAHCFSDDNHVYGNNLFPDFYEWLVFLGEISGRTDYDWYIKLHPDRFPWETAHFEELAQRFPRFRILPAETSHHQIIEEGIRCVLTVYGTIGFEYAALGVPVITASPWNPTVAYGFNAHPKTVAEYEHLLLNIANLRVDVDLRQVYEFYYCQYLSVMDDWLYRDFSKSYDELCRRQGAGGPLAYRLFIDEFSEERHQEILRTVDRFVTSRDYCLRIDRPGRDRAAG